MTVPYLAILATVGLYVVGTRRDSGGGPSRTVLIYCLLIGLALGKTLYEAVTTSCGEIWNPWRRKVNEVAAPGSAIFADEHVYFLTRREPPSGMEYDDSHKLSLTNEQSLLLHVLTRETVKERVRSGWYGTVETCAMTRLKQTNSNTYT